MKTLYHLTLRNLRLFFKDKGMFVTALITPLILLVLYATFLAKVYRDSFASALPPGFEVPASILDATVGGQLISSLLAVSCVTVAFCANLLMVQDRANHTIRDITVTPVKRSTIAGSYFLASALSTLIVTLTALIACLVFLANMGWYMTVADVLWTVFDVVFLTLFGTALSSCLHFFLSTQGQASAIGTIMSAGYGFICGAYMPISNFSSGLQKVLSFLPGTYGTSLIRSHMLRGVFHEMTATGFPEEVVHGIADSIDCRLYFNGTLVTDGTKVLILVGSVVLFTGIFVLLHVLKRSQKS